MYTRYFKLSGMPFTENLDIKNAMIDKRVKEGLARFNYLASGGCIGLLTGQPGVGKSCLLNLYMRDLSKNRIKPVYINLTSLDAKQLLRLILIKLNEVPGHLNGKEKNFLQILEKTNSEESTTVLIIDEVHLLRDDALTDLRLLLNTEPGKDSKLKILLSGLDGIIKKLKGDRHKSLFSRISVRYQLHPLTLDETGAYIGFCMKKANGSEKTFDARAKELIHDYSQGIPRNINNIATASLMHAASMKHQTVDDVVVNTVMEEFGLV